MRLADWAREQGIEAATARQWLKRGKVLREIATGGFSLAAGVTVKKRDVQRHAMIYDVGRRSEPASSVTVSERDSKSEPDSVTITQVVTLSEPAASVTDQPVCDGLPEGDTDAECVTGLARVDFAVLTAQVADLVRYFDEFGREVSARLAELEAHDRLYQARFEADGHVAHPGAPGNGLGRARSTYTGAAETLVTIDGV